MQNVFSVCIANAEYALYPGRQTTFDALDCCKRSSTLNLILRYHGSISTWTTLSTFCWIFFTAPQSWGHYGFDEKTKKSGFPSISFTKRDQMCFKCIYLIPTTYNNVWKWSGYNSNMYKSTIDLFYLILLQFYFVFRKRIDLKLT